MKYEPISIEKMFTCPNCGKHGVEEVCGYEIPNVCNYNELAEYLKESNKKEKEK